jgi:hypothetical protein
MEHLKRHLCNDLRVWVQLQQSSREFSRRRVVVRLGENPDRAAQRDLHVRRLQLTMRKVYRQF